MRYLLKNVLTYRVASEAEAKELIEEAKKDRNFNLSKYSSEYKCVKKKGEIEDEWYRVTLTEEFTAENGKTYQKGGSRKEASKKDHKESCQGYRKDCG